MFKFKTANLPENNINFNNFTLFCKILKSDFQYNLCVSVDHKADKKWGKKNYISTPPIISLHFLAILF